MKFPLSLLLYPLLFFGHFQKLVAQAPTDIILSNNTVPENEDLYTFIGKLSAIDPDQNSGHTFQLIEAADDNDFFKIRADSLFTFFSFNFERKNNYSILIKAIDSSGQALLQHFNILISDVWGKYDQNGYADADIANKYPQVNIGDYIYFNGVTTNDAIYAQNKGYPSVSYPNKILIRGDHYQAISILFSQVHGTNTNQRVPVTNFLGQVYVTNYIELRGGSFWRLTGNYNPSLGLGSAPYRGCRQGNSTANFGFSSGQYGIWVSREWIDEGSNLVKVSGTATGFEIDHLEISDGGFAGLMLKYDNMDIHSMDDVDVHHLYIHDIGSEGMYIGSTQNGAQHVFKNLHIHHCAVLRTGGEAIQISQQDAGCRVEHNVLWGAFDWLSPFQKWQDNIVQLGSKNGDIAIQNNIIMGASGNAINIFNKSKIGIVPNGLPITVENNLIWCSRGNVGAYLGSTDGLTPWVWRKNYAGKFFFDYDRVYPNTTPLPDIVYIGFRNLNITADIVDNCFDYSRSTFYGFWGNGQIQVNSSNNTQKALSNPRFRAFIGESDNFNYLRWTRWTATVGEESGFPSNNTNKGQAVTYTVGDVVQYHVGKQTRFYRCIQTHTQQEPSPNGNRYWKLLTWNNKGDISYLPPDDVRLDVGSFYHTQNIGLMPHQAGLEVDAGADQSHFFPVTTVHLEGNAYCPTDSIQSYQWTQIQGNPLSLSGQNNANLSISNPPIGQYTFVLMASTHQGLVGRDTIELLISYMPQNPIAYAGPDLNLNFGNTNNNLNANLSSDPNGHIISYEWNIIGAPLHPTSKLLINFTNQRYSAHSPWNNVTQTHQGTIIQNLIDSTGNTTTIGIELLNNWNGSNTNGVITGNNTGIVPDTISRSYYWFQSGVHPIRIFGLEPKKLYSIAFFASRSSNGNRTTIYRIGKNSVHLNAAHNSQNLAKLNWMQADDHGEILIYVSKDPASSYAYLNAMMITTTGLSISDPNSINTSISGLKAADYALQLQVIDDECLSDFDTVVLKIAPTPPLKMSQDKIKQSNISLSPNPTKGISTLFIHPFQPNLTCKIHSLAGRVVFHQTIQHEQELLHLEKLPAGVYHIELLDHKEEPFWQSKFVKL